MAHLSFFEQRAWKAEAERQKSEVSELQHKIATDKARPDAATLALKTLVAYAGVQREVFGENDTESSKEAVMQYIDKIRQQNKAQQLETGTVRQTLAQCEHKLKSVESLTRKVQELETTIHTQTAEISRLQTGWSVSTHNNPNKLSQAGNESQTNRLLLENIADKVGYLYNATRDYRELYQPVDTSNYHNLPQLILGIKERYWTNINKGATSHVQALFTERQELEIKNTQNESEIITRIWPNSGSGHILRA